MSGFFEKSQEAALAPLVELAQNRTGDEREHFLQELRRDAPTVARMVESRLGAENPLPALPAPHIRQEVGWGVALLNVFKRSAAVSSSASTSRS